MPAPGDQHKPNGATTANPFEEHKPHISEYTAQEIATLQSRLNKRLGPEFLSTRPGPGNQKIPYLSAEKAINLANEVFGFNGWSTSIQNIQIDFVDENAQTGKVSIGLSVVMRVTLRDGTFHEDIGYGGIENCKGKAMAFEKSKKEATTDALKRALRNFGNVLGNCVYDRDYVTKVSKIKPGNGRFDVNELHRHPDFMPKISEDVKLPVQNGVAPSMPPSLAPEESFDTSEFDDFDFTDNDLGHSEELLLPFDIGTSNLQSNSRPSPMDINTPSKAPQFRQQGQQDTGFQRPPGHQIGNVNGTGSGAISRPGFPTDRTPQGANLSADRPDRQHLSSPGVQSEHFAPQQGQAGGNMPPPAAGFYSARAAKDLDPNTLSALPPSSIKFDPHKESPSLRKTAGVDHTKSVPVRRDLQKAEPIAVPNIVDPRADPNRRIGMPGAQMPSPIARPGMSTSAYRPPTRHNTPTISNLSANGPERGLTAAKRPPLNDVSNVPYNTNAVSFDGADAKRQKVGAGGTGPGGPENAQNVNVSSGP